MKKIKELIEQLGTGIKKGFGLEDAFTGKYSLAVIVYTKLK